MARPPRNIPKVKLSKKQTEDIEHHLKTNGEVEIYPFCIADLRKISSKQTKDHWNDKIITIPSKIKIHYKPNKELERKMQ